LVHTGFVCRKCGFAAETREKFDVDGLAMQCPECASTRVEHQFSEAGR
jgi:putative FmdB family regulatory protein